MKTEFKVAALYGETLIDNRFETRKGTYQIVVRRRNGKLYFFKYRDGILLECQNLNEVIAKESVSNG